MSETIRFPIAGMTCASCVNRITRVLRRLDGVTAVKVDLRRETATVTREPSRASDAALAVAIAGAGYQADLDGVSVVAADELRGILARWFR